MRCTIAELEQLIERTMRVRKDYGLPYDAARGKRAQLPVIWKAEGMLRGVEIGTFRGDFAKLLLDGGMDVTCIDPYLPTSGGKTQAMQDCYYVEACGKVGAERIIREPSLTAVHRFEAGSLDWVFIDGDHSFDACVSDIIAWVPKVKHGGMVCVHDYDAHQCGVVDAVRGYTNYHKITNWCVTREYPSTAIWINP